MTQDDYLANVALVRQYAYEYYVKDNPSISDAEYDALLKGVKEIEAAHPEWVVADSPSQTVGGEPIGTKVTHTRKMLSLDNVYTPEELTEAIMRMSPGVTATFACEPKYDGLTVRVTYRDGLMVRAETRGDGTIGEDVTANALKVKGIPHSIQTTTWSIPPVLEVDFEVTMLRSHFNEINAIAERNGREPYKTPRNAAAGIIRSGSKLTLGAEILTAFVFDSHPWLTEGDGHYFNLCMLHTLGCNWVPDYVQKCHRIDDIVDYINLLGGIRDTLDFETDGAVIKLDRMELRQERGTTNRVPKWAFAFKFPEQCVQTKLLDVIFQISKSGVITPVAIMEPVVVGGVTVTRSTLHNLKEIERLGIMVGDTIELKRGGEVIPKIVRAVKELRTGKEEPINILTHCPCCSYPLHHSEGGHFLICGNSDDCLGQRIERIKHFVRRDAMNVVGLGDKIAEQLVKAELVETPADLYELTEGDLTDKVGLGTRTAQKIIKSLERSRAVTLDKFLVAMAIDNIGEGTAKTIAKRIQGTTTEVETIVSELKSSYQLAEREGFTDRVKAGVPYVIRLDVDYDDDDAVYAANPLSDKGKFIKEEIGPVAFESLMEWLNSDYGTEQWFNFMAILDIQPMAADKEIGELFCITGTIKGMTRDESAKWITEQHGYQFDKKLTTKTKYLFVGDKPGKDKLSKAKKYGIDIIRITNDE